MKKINIENIQIGQEKFDFGDEASIYKLKGRTSLYKEWDLKRRTDESLRKTILNKVQKLEKLEKKESLFKYMVRPNEFVEDSYYYTGYTMQHYDGDKLEEYLTYRDTVILLKKIREALIELENNDVMYFDLNYSNILYTKENGELDFRIIDIDNAVVEDKTMDLLPPFLYKYLIIGGKLDKKALIYAYNHLTVSLLGKFDTRLTPNPYIGTYNRKLAKFAEYTDKPKVDSIIDNEYLIDYYDENKILRSPLF